MIIIIHLACVYVHELCTLSNHTYTSLALNLKFFNFIFSVRANQITESLQKEAKILMEEKEKLTATLKHCQGELQKSTHDAQNLRSALDLFHRSKFISYDRYVSSVDMKKLYAVTYLVLILCYFRQRK